MEFERFTHGIVVVDSKTLVEDNELAILHFVGFTKEATDKDIENVKHEAETVEEFGLMEIHDRCLYLKAPKELVEFYNIVLEETDFTDLPPDDEKGFFNEGLEEDDEEEI